MALLLDTATVTPTERLDMWIEANARLFVPLRIKASTDEPLSGRIRGGSLGGLVQVFELTASPQTVCRSARTIRQADPGLYKLSVQVSGSVLLRQQDREAWLRPGDLAIYDSSQPYELVLDEAFQMLVFVFPHDLLALKQRRIAPLMGRAMSGDGGLAQVASRFLRDLAAVADEGTASDSGARLAEAVIDLVGALCSEHLGAEESGGTLLARIKEHIRRNLADPELSPISVARAHHISLRQLYRLFEAEQTPVVRWIRDCRLDRVRRDLLDPATANLPVGEIAARHGFADASHFSHCFKTEFGVSAREYRRQGVRAALPRRAG